LANARGLSDRDRRESFVFGLLAVLTALWRILKLLVPEKDLLAYRPRKILIAIDTCYRTIDEFKGLCSCDWGRNAETIHFTTHKNFPYISKILLVQQLADAAKRRANFGKSESV
jgi:hypothetical protein